MLHDNVVICPDSYNKLVINIADLGLKLIDYLSKHTLLMLDSK